MKNQPQRLLSKSRTSKSSDDDESSIENDGWISITKKREFAPSLSLVRPIDLSRSNKKKLNAVSFIKIPSKGDDSSSSSSSYDSYVNPPKSNKKEKSYNTNGECKKSSKETTMPRAAFTKVAHRVGKAGIRTSTTPKNAPSSTACSSSRANKVPMPEGITSPSQLQWYRIILGQGKSGMREKLQPCRKLSAGEMFDYRRKHGGQENNEGTTIIEYLTLSNEKTNHCLCVDDNLLIPFGYRTRDGISFTFNEDYLQRFMQEQRKICRPSELETLKLFIERVFRHAIRMEKEAKEQADEDLEDYYDDCSIGKDKRRVQFVADEESRDDNENESDDELDAPYTQAITFDPDNSEPLAENETSNEPIRVGDVIEYYSPIHVAGDPRGLRQATVLAIDPKNEIPLVLDNAECIPNDTNVKRIKVELGGELVGHPGIFRPISRFKLSRTGRATIVDALAKQTTRIGGIMRKNMKRLKAKAEADGFAPMDLFVNIKGVDNYSSQSSEYRAREKRLCQSLMSSSFKSSGDDSSDDESPRIVNITELHLNNRNVELKGGRVDTPKLRKNKENARSVIHRDRELNLGSLQSKASLGASLASSDDEDSIESAQLNLGTNHEIMTQQLQQERDAGIKKSRKSGALFDLSLSSDDSVNSSPKSSRKKSPGALSTKHKSLKRSLSSDSSVSSESVDLTIPKNLKRKMSRASFKSSCSTTTGSSEKRSERKRTPDTKTYSSFSSSAGMASPEAKKVRTYKPNMERNSSQEHSSKQSEQHKDIEAEATNDLGWTQSKGGWERSNENTIFSFSIGRFK